MRIEIEFKFSGLNHFKRFYRYDKMWGVMTKGFQFRFRPVFVVLTKALK